MQHSYLTIEESAQREDVFTFQISRQGDVIRIILNLILKNGNSLNKVVFMSDDKIKRIEYN